MRRPISVGILFLSIVLAAAFSTHTADASSRLHPELRALLASEEVSGTAAPLGVDWFASSDRYQILITPTGEARIGVLAKLADPASDASLRGIPVLARAGGILALSVSMADLLALASNEDVVYVEPAWRTEPALDRSVPAIRADDVHTATPPILGEGVVIGIVDTGIDYLHLDFRTDANGDGFEETSRIDSILDQTRGLLGTQYTRAQIESDIAAGLGATEGIVRSIDRDGHGTHVSSIAAGDGSSSSYGLIGVAPKATLVAVKTTFYTSDILAAVEFIFDRADALGLPAVANLSLGGHEGPHDGTSLFEEGLDRLVDGPGRAIVVSAGNEGNLSIHTSGVLQGGGTSFVVVPDEWEVEVGVWYPGSSAFTITVEPPGGAAVSVPAGVSSGYVTTGVGTVYVDNASGGLNPNNGDHEVFVRLANVNVGDRWRIGVLDQGGGGRFDAWITSPEGSIESGDSTSTIDEPGNGQRVITVGSFNSKGTWPSLAGPQDFSAQYPLGALSAFSSHGPTRDGRTKPEVCAPGAWICAAGSSDAAAYDYLTHPDDLHVMELGTSMAAPHVSGTIALMFDLDAGLTFEEVRGILISEAAADSSTGSVPNARWGWGELDALAAVEAVEATEPEPPVAPERPEIGLEENPARSEARFVFSTPQGTRTATLRVYTVAGSLVFETSVSPSAGSYEWNLRSDRGETMATGLYLYVLVTDKGSSEVGRLVIAR
jgi:subtilisin family serine protease